MVDEKRILEWKNADYARVSVFNRMRVPNPEGLFLGAGCPFEITRVTLKPVSGPPRRLR